MSGILTARERCDIHETSIWCGIIGEIHTHQPGHWWWMVLESTICQIIIRQWTTPECLPWTEVQQGMIDCSMEIWPFLSSRGIVILRRFILWGYHLRVPTVFTFRRGHWYCYPWDRWLIVWELYFRNHPESTCRTGHVEFVGFIINFWLLFWTLFRSYLRMVLVFTPLIL